jgi:RNA polymerase sigma factor (sigma-70 family)
MKSNHPKHEAPSPGDFAEDRRLVERYLAGDKAAGDELTTLLTPVISCVVGRLLGQRPRTDWEDARQSIWLRIIERLDTWQARCPLSAWVWVVATRRALDIREKRWPISLSGDALAALPAKRPETDPVLGECIASTISRFPTPWREVLRSVVDGEERQEIADRMGVARRTIQYWLERMRNRLLRCVEGRRRKAV